MIAKVRAYIDAGVVEVALVELDDRVRWFRADGEFDDSVHGVVLTVPR